MTATAVLEHGCGNPLATTPLFRVGLAESLDDLIACQRLRYLVFNCELGEGLDVSARTGLDRDQFDFICDHLMVTDASTGLLVGTYRMQTGYRAKGNLGYMAKSSSTFLRSKASVLKFSSSVELACTRGIVTLLF